VIRREDEVGKPPARYLRETRLANAATMLAHSQASIEAIAEVCGFCDRNYFSTVFRKGYGVGPATYRRQVLA
jgi:AraC family L-rhamnose operon regulatory protein RhaS